ncbi:MAG: hypothetical protein NZ750_01155 [Anaerolineae bacterium]|nr:hypothetical protein [Anaerolineae bacterium]MDW8173193.1 hypothetical protein [Anaerolineae bacterium]
MPAWSTTFALVIGVAIGLFWAYNVNPTVFNGANPNRLNQPAQDQWIKLVSASFQGGYYTTEEAANLLNRVDNPAASVQRLIDDPNTNDGERRALQAVQPLVVNLSGTPTPQSPGLLGELIQFIVPLILFLILFPVLTLIYRLLIQPNFVAPAIQRFKEMRDPELRAKNQRAREELKRLQEQKAELERIKSETVADADLGEPVMQTLKVYSTGRSFDEAQEIEVDDRFLGQCGAVIPETVGNDPVAVEIWLFDMFADGDQNHKKLFVAQAALNDPSIRARLASDPDVRAEEFVLAAPGSKLTIDAEKIRLVAEMTSVELTENGRFASFRMKMAAWDKSNKKPSAVSSAPQPVTASYAPPSMPSATLPSPVASGMPPMSAYDDIRFDPPPMPSSRPTTPSTSVGAPPMSVYDNIQFDPPPSMPSRPSPIAPPPMPSLGDEDDPFGGTGDFTPVPRR